MAEKEKDSSFFKNPKDFKVTGESGITIKQEPFLPEGEIMPRSVLTEVYLESQEYGNCQRLTMEFIRHNADGVFPDVRIFANFYRHETAQKVSDKLKSMVSEIRRQCIEELSPKLKD